ncbi:LytTR family DNA-binding domain-containing protein [Pedobacter sp. Hv1]|uniref:LytR/AlgR family response regulator transcription factor n=1 Tax=Pedobacter sp. Hv1 TaxID=1740090 RepID=UPI0006D8B567|nr:LytTR family DNA-binding domain-containing protein [Pedobacter sp. Hv1]KQB99720.1 LytTR family transcriptional regulator [Pedobacter sp. Hv1]
MKNCLIVDDEPLALDIIESYVNGNEQLCLIKKCNTAFEAFEVLHHIEIDLLFLDIKMPGLNGIDFIKSLKNPPAVIFTTAFSEYAAASYDLEAVDYLLKPITLERFNKSLDKFFKLQPVAVNEEKDYTYFKVSGKLVKVEHVNILYAQSIKDYLMLYTSSGNLIVHMTMKYLNELLPEHQFMRVHRSYLVNQSHINSIGKNQIQINEVEIPIGEHYKEILLRKKAKL